MQLNNKGQCPVCLIKPLTYKKDGYYFCHRCNRSFSMLTGEWIRNAHWVGENEKSRLSRMAELATKTGIARPCDYHEDGLHKFIECDEWEKTCACGAVE